MACLDLPCITLPYLVSLIVHTISTSDGKYFVTVLWLGVMRCSEVGQGEAKKQRKKGKESLVGVSWNSSQSDCRRISSQHSKAQYSISQHSTFWFGTAQHSTVRLNKLFFVSSDNHLTETEENNWETKSESERKEGKERKEWMHRLTAQYMTADPAVSRTY